MTFVHGCHEGNNFQIFKLPHILTYFLVKRRYLYIQRRTDESSQLMDQDFPKGVLRTPEQLQEIMYRHGVLVKIEDLCMMDKKNVQDTFKMCTDEQKKVINNCRIRRNNFCC